MITSTIILDFIKKIVKEYNIDIGNYNIGTLDIKKYKTIALYKLNTGIKTTVLGGNDNKTFEDKYVSLVVHYNNNYVNSELISNNIYEALDNIKTPLTINDNQINYIQLLDDEPKFSGVSDNGIYNFTINFKISYNNNI